MNLDSIPEMRVYIERLGYKDLNALNVIHVAGTKGKGSTSAFVDSVLRRLKVKSGDQTKVLKTGLFTSPHLMEARERIRINGDPISQQCFSNYFYQVWDLLKENQALNHENIHVKEFPAYFRFLTLMAFHVFIQERVDVVILEVGIGGEYDSTNVIESPLVCCITSLGFDHVNLLGNTIESIAFHKAGIFKKDAVALTVEQPAGAMNVIYERAAEREVESIQVVSEAALAKEIELGLKGEYQRINASIALAACNAWIKEQTKFDIETNMLHEVMLKGLEAARWPGRSQVLLTEKYPNSTFYLDGAHTAESIQVCVDWFSKEIHKFPHDPICLIFNLTRSRNRSQLLNHLVSFNQFYRKFSKVIFCPNISFSPGSNKAQGSDLVDYTETHSIEEQEMLKHDWIALTNDSNGVHVANSIQEAIAMASSIDESRILVTGSLHLVGGLLSVLEAPVT